MKNQIVSYCALALSVAALGWHYLDTPPKVAYAETSVVLAEFTEAIQARKRFEETQKEWDKNLKLLNDSMMAAMDRMKSQYDAVGKEEKEKLRARLQQRNDDLQRYSNAVKQMSVEKEKELMTPVLKKVNSFLDLWGKQHGYDLILGTTTEGNILQADAGMNMTATILKDLNQHYRDLPVADSAKTEAVAKVEGKK